MKLISWRRLSLWVAAEAPEQITRFAPLPTPVYIPFVAILAKRVHQFVRDVADELLWIEEKKPLAEDKNVGNSLQSVQHLQKKCQVS